MRNTQSIDELCAGCRKIWQSFRDAVRSVGSHPPIDGDDAGVPAQEESQNEINDHANDEHAKKKAEHSVGLILASDGNVVVEWQRKAGMLRD